MSKIVKAHIVRTVYEVAVVKIDDEGKIVEIWDTNEQACDIHDEYGIVEVIEECD